MDGGQLGCMAAALSSSLLIPSPTLYSSLPLSLISSFLLLLRPFVRTFLSLSLGLLNHLFRPLLPHSFDSLLSTPFLCILILKSKRDDCMNV